MTRTLSVNSVSESLQICRRLIDNSLRPCEFDFEGPPTAMAAVNDGIDFPIITISIVMDGGVSRFSVDSQVTDD